MNDTNNAKPIRQVQPVVVPLQYFIFGPLAAGFLSLFPGMFAFIISNMIAQSFDPVIRYGLIVYLISFAVVMYLLYLKFFLEPEKTSYRIFENKLEYDEGFLNKSKRTVVFDQVIDVLMTEGVFQQAKGAGSVTLMTQQLVAAGNGKLSNRAVVLKNVPNPQEIYDLIRGLATKGTSD